MEKITSKMCLNGDVGIHGNMFGGQLMYLMDEAAAIYAVQYTGVKRIVSRKFSAVEFHAPVRRGEILEFFADNPKRGNTSFSFDIIVKVEGNRRFQSSCVFVAIDENGEKTPIDWDRAPGCRKSAKAGKTEKP